MTKKKRSANTSEQILYSVTSMESRGTVFIPDSSGASIPVVAGQTVLLKGPVDHVDKIRALKNLVITIKG